MKTKKRSIFSEMWDLWVERCQAKKALRLLNKQEWSVEFLTTMLVRAAQISHQQLQMTIKSPNGAAIVISTVDSTPAALRDDDIFNHLDDEVKIKQFMDMVGRS